MQKIKNLSKLQAMLVRAAMELKGIAEYFDTLPTLTDEAESYMQGAKELYAEIKKLGVLPKDEED